MRPAYPNMYGQPTYVLPPNPGVQYYTTANSPLPQYVRNSQELQQPQQQPQQQQQQLQPMYLVQPPMHQYPALVGVPTQVVGNPMPQAMAIQGVPAGWAYSRSAMPEPAPMWGYGARGFNDQQQPQHQQQHQQQQLETRNWQPAPSQGYPGLGLQGRAEGPGNGGGSFQGRAEGLGNGVGNFQGRAGNVQPYVGRASGGEVRRPDRGFENNRHYSSGGGGGGGAGRSQYGNRPALPPLQSKQLNCEPCEKTFSVYAQYTAHMNTHVPCDDPGCSFSASGKVVKEHKLTVHSKSSNPIPMRSTLKKSVESKAEIRAWREERRRNYPTRLNIQRKKDILEGKVARGELIDEDARQRRMRMKEILARQAELGCPVAEVPAYYLSNKDDKARGRKVSDRSKQMPSSTAENGSSVSTIIGSELKKRKLGEDATVTTEEHPSKSARMNADLSNSHSNSSAELPTQAECENSEGVKVVPPEAGSQLLEKAPRAQCFYYQRGRCKKGNKCHFAHVRNKKGGEEAAARRGRHQKGTVPEKRRPPTLLSKLLQPEITRDKSYILQCLRFFVNNNFLVDGIVELPFESESEESSYYSEGEVVEAPDVLLADAAIINTLLSERPEVLAKVIELETQA